jgi:hypothetical protein
VIRPHFYVSTIQLLFRYPGVLLFQLPRPVVVRRETQCRIANLSRDALLSSPYLCQTLESAAIITREMQSFLVTRNALASNLRHGCSLNKRLQDAASRFLDGKLACIVYRSPSLHCVEFSHSEVLRINY